MEIQVPLELQVVLREFTKTVLRERPSDVLEFSRDYFVEKAAQYRMCELQPVGPAIPAAHALTAAFARLTASYALPPSNSKTYDELPAEIKEQVQAVFKR